MFVPRNRVSKPGLQRYNDEVLKCSATVWPSQSHFQSAAYTHANTVYTFSAGIGGRKSDAVASISEFIAISCKG